VSRSRGRRLAAVAALLALAASCARIGRAPQPAPPGPAPLPEPVAAPPAAPAASPPPAVVETPAEPIERIAPRRPVPRFPEEVRIGLRSDLESVTLPCCDGEVTAEAGGERLEVVSPITIRPGAQAESAPVWRLQAAAIRDQEPAAALARRLAERTGQPADARFDAGSGLYRVRVGRWPTREQAEAASRRLKLLGLEASWVVSEGGGIAHPALDISQRGHGRRIAGRVFSIRAPAGGGLRVDGRRYRGAILVYLNDRGRLNVINRLRVEDYLRGVVPSELGPGEYPELEALKAQAVAARSYTLRNLNGFEDEGYDLCGTPQCQVYGGMDMEHPLSDRAVAETRGEVLLYDGEIAEALYSATCGGHTENAEVVFPLKHAPYLRGVPCIEAGSTELAGDGVRRAWPGRLLDPFLPATEGALTARELERAIRGIVEAAGLAAPDDHLVSLGRREVQRFLASMLDLRADARLFVSADEINYLVADPPLDWNAQDRRFAAWLAKSGLLFGPDPAAALSAEQCRELALRVALFLRVVERRTGSFSSLGDGRLVLRGGDGDRAYPLPESFATWRIEGDSIRPARLTLLPGDAVALYFEGDRLMGVTQEVDPDGAAFDRSHDRSSWTRFRTDAEVATAVRARFPGFPFKDLRVLSRGVSGRVGRLRLIGADGESVDVEGLAVRWTLDLPDTLFTVRRLTPKEGRSGWQFTGRGWGHGVGMCQTGAYGMARRGNDYRAILHHYYTDVRIERIEYAPGG